MPLLTLADAELAFGDYPLLDRAAFALEEREREHQCPHQACRRPRPCCSDARPYR